MGILMTEWFNEKFIFQFESKLSVFLKVVKACNTKNTTTI